MNHRVIQHYDYIEARSYAHANNKNLKDLTTIEMQMFKKNVIPLDENKIIKEKTNE